MKNYLALFKETWTEFSDDKASRLGAGLAYYTIFSIAPLLLIAIAIAGIVFGREAAQGQILAQLRGVLGTGAADAVQELVKNAAKPKAGTMATIVGIVTLFFGASGVFTQLKDALNTIWNVEPKKAGGIMAMLRQQFLSVTMVMGVGFLLLVSLVLDTAIAAVGHYASGLLPGGEALWHALELLLSFGVVTVLFALMFRYLPDVKIEWRDVWLGAGFTSLLFVLGKFALGLYIAKAAPGSSFGAAGSLVVVLVWVYWSAQILFFGAEFTQVYARTHGSHSKATAPAESKAKLDGHVPADAAGPTGAPAPAVIYRTQKAGGGAGKLAVGGLAGMVVGAFVGGIGALVMVVKSAKKLFT